MSIEATITNQVKQAIEELFQVKPEKLEFQPTRKDFEGDITLVTFPLLRQIKTSPVQLGEALGKYLVEHNPDVEKYNVVQGFLNIVLSNKYYLDFFASAKDDVNFGKRSSEAESIMVEYSSPNTNKPLHLGHVRNNLLGFSVAEILKASGRKVYKTQIINDRGIHICKSMLAWKRYGNGETPETTGLKGDKLVGNYYVKFDRVYKEEIEELKAQGKTEEEAKTQAPILWKHRKCCASGKPETGKWWTFGRK